ncbi:spondin-1 isoform X2 [Fopius arisanus]|uniref:Spondin-1 n=1 Tax=Fopius arisanus TaxID=64838 RepID=A0A9R1T0E5_9HYME|nr:PREDICTED: spondin-1 isoform X2 [Fopius arisanus]
MAHHVRLIMLVLLGEIFRTSLAGKCDRKLDGLGEPAGNLDGRIFITLWALNKTEIVETYMPNTRYIVSIEGEKGREFRGPQKFTRFLLTAENTNISSTAEGTLDLIDEDLTQFSDKCLNAVTESSMVLKESANVAWISPPADSGCILIRASVAESAETWYMDEYGIIKTVCQDPRVEEDDPGPVLQDCCACDEAKYEVTFEGLWSRNTHPKDFPSKSWLIRFSDVIGASHTVDYRFWRYNDTSSNGLQQVAEFGSTRTLESELKEQSAHIRTIIKARGVGHPNVTGRTFAVFRVDRKHHLMSLVSMIVPSPDWIVGVSGLELCLSNCSWIEHKELNLYPVDAGTDDGITYMSPDSPTDPHEPIRRITSTWPNDTRSPFYDPLGADMKPMAKLHLNRQRLYDKICDEAVTSSIDSGGDNRPDPPHRKKPKVPKACKTTRWGEWEPCSVTCGRGIRLRQKKYRDEQAAAANNCNVRLTDKQECIERGPNCNGLNGDSTILNTPECELTDWTDWSECTTTCGDGIKTRSRNFANKRARKRCRAASNDLELEQTIDCQNQPCSENGTSGKVRKCPGEYHPWSLWTPCSATCGRGIKQRSRLRIGDSSSEPLECTQQSVGCDAKITRCDITKEDAEEICNEPPPIGDCNPDDGSHSDQRVYFDPGSNQCRVFRYTGCNSNRRNNFDTPETCKHVCIDIRGTNRTNARSGTKNMRRNYKVSLSSVLSYHIPAQKERSGKIKRERKEGIDETFNGIQLGSQTTEEYRGKKIDCKFTEWSPWTQCENCRGYSTQTRTILVKARNGGMRCPTKLERKKKCHRVLNCPPRNRSRRRRYRDHKSVWEMDEVSIDCELSHWSPWSPCNVTCGNATQHRTRRVKVQPYGPTGKPCTKLVEFRRCSRMPCYY